MVFRIQRASVLNDKLEKKNLNSLKATAQKDLLRKGSKQSGTQTNKLCLKRSLLIGIAKIIYLLVA